MAFIQRSRRRLQEDSWYYTSSRLAISVDWRAENQVEPRAQVVLYTKPGCTLCEEMKAAISIAGCAGLYTLEEIDIEGEAELFARYQYEIPVLFINGVEAFRHRLRPDEFKAYVTGLVSEES